MLRGPRGAGPWLAELVLGACVPREALDAVLGDLQEAHDRRRAQGDGARLWYWSQVASLAIHYGVDRLRGRRRRTPTREGMKMIDIGSDVRLALRGFRKSPGFAVTSAGVLAVGLGAVTFMFSTLDAVALRPMAFEDPEELVWVWSSSEQYPRNSMSLENYLDHRARSSAFEELAAFLTFRPGVALAGTGEPERVVSNHITANLFTLLGVQPALGRGLVEEDGQPGAVRVAVVSHGVWLRRYGAEPSAVGSTLNVDGVPHEVVGVMPPGFDYPGGIDVWLPARLDEGYAQGRGNNNFNVVGRLAEGVALEQAQAQMDGVAAQLEEAYPGDNAGLGVVLVPLHELYFGDVRQALVILLCIVTFVLVIACANVASLSLARAVARRGEVAVRLSLGAARVRIVRQLLTENMVLALAGGAVGVGLAHVGTRLLKAFGPPDLPRLEQVGIDGRVWVFALLVSVLTGLVFGTVPALRGAEVSLSDGLKTGGFRGGSVRHRGRSALVVAQVALSLALMITSGLLVRSFVGLQAVDLGFETKGLLVAELQVPEASYSSRAEARQVWDEIRGSLRTLPKVVEAGATDQLPIRGGGTTNGVFALGRRPNHPSQYLPAQRRFVTVGFLEALGVPTEDGRGFLDTDDEGGTPVTVVNRSLATRLWPGERAVGQVLVLPWGDGLPLEVVGVVGDVRDRGPGQPAPPTFYMPMRQLPFGVPALQVVMRTDGDPMAVAERLREAVWAVDADVPVSGVQAMTDRVDERIAQPRFRATLVGLFAAASLGLATLGLYALLAYLVRQRSHEIAVRVAVGASPAKLVALVLARAMALVGAGVLLGIGGGLAGGRVLAGLMFGVESRDPATLLTVTAVMLVVALLASLVPARRATRVAPVEALHLG